MHTENVFHTWNNTINSNLNQHVIVTQLEMALYFSMPSFAVLSPYIVTIQLFQITNNLNIAKFVIWKSCICHYVPLLHMKLPVYECVLIDWLIDWLILVIFLKLTYVCPWSYRNVYIIIIIIVVVVVIIICIHMWKTEIQIKKCKQVLLHTINTDFLHCCCVISTVYLKQWLCWCLIRWKRVKWRQRLVWALQ